MRGLFALTFLLCAFQALAGETLTKVVAVVESLKTERLLILSGVDGRVYKTGKYTKKMKKEFEAMKGMEVLINFNEINGEAIITSMVPMPAHGDDVNLFTPNDRRDLSVTDVGSEKEAQRLFNLLNDGDKSNSQCFKRAHMWAWDMWTREKIISQKVFIFYSRRYIQLEKFDWWFHVAPVVTAGGVDYALDKTFMKKAVTLKEWKEKFMKASITCPAIKHYEEYESRPLNRLCFIMKTPMWYFRPADIRARDYKGIEKQHWELMELQDARRAFKDGLEKYEALDTGSTTVTH